jgi:type II secretion system protein N
VQALIERVRNLELTPRQKQLATWIGYPLFAIFVVLMTFLGSVPRDRVKDRLEAALSADVGSGEPMAIGLDVTIGDLSLTMLTGAGVKATDVVLRTRPPNPADKPARYVIDDVRLRIGLLATLFGHPSYSFKGHALSGIASGKIASSTDESSILVELEKIVLTGVPGLQQSVGLPLEGVVSGKLDLTMPKQLLANANGTVDIAIDDAAIGDGKAKLTVPNDPFLSAGLTFPRIKLGRLSGQIVVEKGRARFEGVRVHSADVDATLEGYVELHDPIGTSQMHGYLKFRPSEALTKREPTLELVNTAMAQAKRADGFIGIQMSGPLQTLFVVPSKEPPYGVTTRNEPAAATPSSPLPALTTPLPTPPIVQAPPPPPPPQFPPNDSPPSPPPNAAIPPAAATGANPPQPAPAPTTPPPAASAAPGENREVAAPPPVGRVRAMTHEDSEPAPHGGE